MSRTAAWAAGPSDTLRCQSLPWCGHVPYVYATLEQTPTITDKLVIESASKAILYTGDIRSEPWFVNSLVRNPNLIEYASGIRRLDKIYLDTSFTQDIPFQTKAEGIAELLRKVARYPSDTIFHLQAWTYGYEEVWVALSRVLKSPVSRLCVAPSTLD